MRRMLCGLQDCSAMAQIAAFLAVSVLVIVTPGQDTALTVRNTLLGGRAAGVLTALGVAAGQATWTVATGIGVGAVLVASQPAFMALRIAGGAYLVVLGAQALWAAVRPKPQPITAAARSRPVRVRAFRQGMLSNLGNPKMLVFFTSLLPQFAHTAPGLIALGLVFCSLTAAWLCGYALAVARAGDVLRGRLRRLLDAFTGCVLVGLGLRLAAER
jgi:threonine/homoserine/homoserine lactone efflux protein